MCGLPMRCPKYQFSCQSLTSAPDPAAMTSPLGEKGYHLTWLWALCPASEDARGQARSHERGTEPKNRGEVRCYAVY